MTKIKASQPKHNIQLLSKDGPLDAKASVEALLERHAPGSKEHTGWDQHRKMATQDMVKKSMPFITARRIRKAFRKFGATKAPGPDKIFPIMVKNAPREFLEYLALIYKGSITIGYTPAGWRASEMIFIPKQGKPTYTEPGSFRPITLTSFLFKGLERLMQWWLNDNHFRNKPMINSQFAFMRGRSTEAALSRTIDKIESAIHRNRQAMGVFLDIKGAFDNLSHEAAIKAMTKRGMPETFVSWYGQYLKERTVHCMGERCCTGT